MVQQVRMSETYLDTSMTQVDRVVFAFGTHPQATPDEQHAVTSAKAINNKLRIIMDELLVGNYLEEIQCRGVVDGDAYDKVPLKATPDDIAKCSVTKDALKASCVGDNLVCICQQDAGCGMGIAKGDPVGVLDNNQDGAPDDTHFIDGAVGFSCGSTGITVPIDIDMTYWNPSGTQQVPATGGLDALGPAIVLVPKGVDIVAGKPSRALPTSAECHLTFADNVVDKQGNKVCTPSNGDINTDCNPGDLNAFKFTVEPLAVQNLQGIGEGDTGVPRNMPALARISAPVKASTINSITITENGMPFTAFTATLLQPDQATAINIVPTGGMWGSMRTYAITFPSAITDLYGQPLTQKTITFTTAP